MSSQQREVSESLSTLVLDLAHRPKLSGWIRRRVDELSMMDERTVDHKVTYFIDLSQLSVGRLPIDTQRQLLLPIERLPRDRHIVTQVADNNSHELMRPTQDFERELAVAGISKKWRHRISCHAWELAEDALRTPARRLTRSAQQELGTLTEKETAYMCAEASGLTSPEERLDLIQDLIRWLRSYLLIVEIPKDLQAQQRFVLTLAYAESVTPRRVIDSEGFHLRSALLSVTRLLGGTLATGFQLSVRPSVGTAESSHIVVAAPQGFQAIDVRTIVAYRVDFDGPTDATTQSADSGTVSNQQFALRSLSDVTVILLVAFICGSITLPDVWKTLVVAPVVSIILLLKRRAKGKPLTSGPPIGSSSLVECVYREDDRLRSSAHIFLPNHPYFVREATLVTNFYAYKSGLLVQTLFSTLILWGVVQAFYDRIAAARFYISGAGIVEAYAAPLILLLPAAVATIVTQRDSHRIASRCSILPRFFAAAASTASAGAAIMLALDVPPDVARPGWRAALLVTQVAAARMAICYVVHLYRTSRLRAWLHDGVDAVTDSEDQERLLRYPPDR